MNVRFHRIANSLRIALARRPWIRWTAVATMSAVAGWLALGVLGRVDDARAEWTDLRTVYVADVEHRPGDPLVVRRVELPEIAVPVEALFEPPDGLTARQVVSSGEVVTRSDVASGSGPAAAAEDGQVVVPVSDPLLQSAMTTVSVGLAVEVHSEGVVLVDDARIVAVDGDVVFVALDPSAAPAVSAAAQLRSASIAFVR